MFPATPDEGRKRGAEGDGRSVTSETQPVAQNGDVAAGRFGASAVGQGVADNERLATQTGWRWVDVLGWGIDYRRWRRFQVTESGAYEFGDSAFMNADEARFEPDSHARVRICETGVIWASIVERRSWRLNRETQNDREVVTCMLTWSTIRCPGAAREPAAQRRNQR